MATYAAASSNSETNTLFEPDIIMPSHFLRKESGTSRDGERRLMAAILSDGIEAFILQSSSNSVNSRRSKKNFNACLLYTSPSPRDATLSRMPSSA